ncbi:hypothetical protein KCU98_g4717, partial [Aureobasidium melanogenum]
MLLQVTKGIKAYVKMAEAFGTASAVIAVLTTAFKASKTLYELSQSIRGHPKEVRDMREEFMGLVTILDRLQGKPNNSLLSKDTMLKAPLEGCLDCCKELNKSLEGLGSPGVGDWLKLQFKNKAIREVKTRLASYKEHLSLVLQIIELEETSASRDDMVRLREQMRDIRNDIEYELQSLNNNLMGAQESVQEVFENEEERRKLEADLAACQAAERVIDDRYTRTIFVLNNNTTSDNSRQFIGTDSLSFEGRFTGINNHAGPSSVQRLGMFSSDTHLDSVETSTTPATRNREATMTVDDVHIQRLVIGGASTSFNSLPGVRGESDDDASTSLPSAQHHRQD